MRNWNRAWAWIPSREDSRVASLPMRNWNSSMEPIDEKGEERLRAFLWGIETKVHVGRYNIFIILVASLPMRNWNRFQCSYTFAESQRCDPSYEELKPSSHLALQYSHSWLRAFLWGIETKLGAAFRTQRPQRCEPSYEELKLRL